MPLPAGLDPADLVAEQGAEAARALVDASQPYVRFRVERELERGDVHSAEGKDKIIEALRPAFATLAPSALREELLAHVADRLDLAPSLVSSWLVMAGGVGPAALRTNGHGGGGGGHGATAVAEPTRIAAGSPITRAERDFLAQCLASPDAAGDVLGSVDEADFSSDGMRRVLAHVRDHLRDPHADLGDDDVLTRSIAALVALAATLPPSRAALQGQYANLRLARLDVGIKDALRAGVGGVTELRRERDALAQRRDALLQEAMEESSPDA